MTEYSCDRCNQPITSSRTELRHKTGPEKKTRPQIDLCARCAEALWAWLDSGPAAREEATS